MGVCFDCLVTIDGHPNVQACMVSARGHGDPAPDRRAPAGDQP
ncbi:2Fe-2S iron-sulfur cluster-binding protein [Gemmobacter lanyuensis]